MRSARVLFLVAVALALAGCGGGPAATPPDPGDAGSPAASAGPTASTGAVVPDSPVAGVVIDVDSRGLDDVRGFTLRTSGGDLVSFTVGELENGDEFPPGHLTEHQAAAAPVLVFFREDAGQLIVYRIEDAG